MPNSYKALAPVYIRLGMAQFAANITPHLVTFAQQNEWLGRRILDLGCGTGASTLWFAQYGYMVVGLDHTPEMLQILRTELNSRGMNARLIEQDVRALSDVESIDMALALDVLNELDNLRDLELVLKNVHGVLTNGKLFIFDLHTAEGLARRGALGDALIVSDTALAAFAHNVYDYERQALTSDYIVFRKQNDHWQRDDGQRILRAYPVQAVATLLRRTGFEILKLLDERLNPIEPGTPGSLRVIFVAVKQ